MRTRMDLHNKFKELLGSEQVYYQPPESLKMQYPAIRYSKADITNIYANNIKYHSHDVFDVVIISKIPDHPVIKKILELPYTEFDHHYVSDNLNHDIIRIYL